LTGAIGSFVANKPALFLVLVPTEADCHDCIISDIGPSSQFGLPPLPDANGRIWLHFVLLVTLLVAKPTSPK
jgi:hypothetical protein